MRKPKESQLTRDRRPGPNRVGLKVLLILVSLGLAACSDDGECDLTGRWSGTAGNSTVVLDLMTCAGEDPSGFVTVTDDTGTVVLSISGGMCGGETFDVAMPDPATEMNQYYLSARIVTPDALVGVFGSWALNEFPIEHAWRARRVR